MPTIISVLARVRNLARRRPPLHTIADFEAEGITVLTFEAGGNTDIEDFEALGYVA